MFIDTLSIKYKMDYRTDIVNFLGGRLFRKSCVLEGRLLDHLRYTKDDTRKQEGKHFVTGQKLGCLAQHPNKLLNQKDTSGDTSR